MKTVSLKKVTTAVLLVSLLLGTVRMPVAASEPERRNIAPMATVTQDIMSGLQSDTLSAVNDGVRFPAKPHGTGGVNPYAWTNYDAAQKGNTLASLTFTFDKPYYVSEIVLYQFVDSWSAELPESIDFYGIYEGDFGGIYGREWQDMWETCVSREVVSDTCVKLTYAPQYGTPLLTELIIRETAKNGKKQMSNCVGLYEVEIIGSETWDEFNPETEREAPVYAISGAIVASEDTAHGQQADNLTDNDPRTIWHTAWEGCAPEDRYVILELSGVEQLVGLNYYGRSGNRSGDNNGRVKDYKVEISNDGVNWQTVDQGRWKDSAGLKTSRFETDMSYVRYVRLTGLTTYGSKGNENKGGRADRY